jgi:hypothetical protein
MPNVFQDTLGDAPEGFEGNFYYSQSMEKPKEYWRPLRQYLQINRDMLGNAQVKVEICWAHISRRLRKDENPREKAACQ